MLKNATLQSLLLCDTVQNIHSPQGIKTNIMDVFDAIQLPCMPSLCSFFIVASVRYEKIDDENTIRIVIRDPDEETVLDTKNMPLSPEPPIHALPGQTIFNFNMDVRNIYIRQSGLYAVSIYLNDEEVGRKTFDILLIEGVIRCRQ